MAKREGQMIGKGLARPITLVENLPVAFIAMAAADVPGRGAAWPPHRRGKREPLDERSPTREPRPFGDRDLLEYGACAQT